MVLCVWQSFTVKLTRSLVVWRFHCGQWQYFDRHLLLYSDTLISFFWAGVFVFTWKWFSCTGIDMVRVWRPTRHIIGHFKDGLHSQSLGCQWQFLQVKWPNQQCYSTKRQNTVDTGWAEWFSGRTSVSGQCSLAVLRSTCNWWVTTYVGKPSTIGQPTRPTQPFILSGSINE